MPCRAVIAFTESPRSCAELARAQGCEVDAACDLKTPPGRERLEQAICSGKVDGVVVDTITALAAQPLEALRVVSTTYALGIKVLSVQEPWLAAAAPGLAQLLAWLDGRKKAARLLALSDAVSRSERRPGRPRRQIDPDRASELLERLPVDTAARELGVGGATLRRWIKARREDQKLDALLRPCREEAA